MNIWKIPISNKPAGRVTRARTRARKAKKKINFID